MLKNISKFVIFYLLIVSVLLCNKDTYYEILYLGVEPITSEETHFKGVIISNEIKNVDEIKVIGEITANDKIKNIKIFDEQFKFLEENILSENHTVDVEKFKQYLLENQKKSEEYLKWLGGGVSFLRLEPFVYNEKESEIDNYIKYLQRSGLRLAVLSKNEYEKYLQMNESEKIKEIKEIIKKDVLIQTE